MVGTYSDATGRHGFLYNPNNGGTYTTLNDPVNPHDTLAYGINDAGQVVGYYFDGNNHEHGFLYSGGIYITLDDPLATNGTNALGINNAGQIVGQYQIGTVTHGFLLTISPNPPAPASTTA